MTSLEKSILSAIVYSDILNLPLTSWEIFEYLIEPLSLRKESALTIKYNYSDLIGALDNENPRKFISEKNGFYFLKGRDDLYEKRIERQKIADQKYKKTLKIVKLFAFIPFVRAVCANGSLALNNTESESDLDVLVFVKSGRIWTTRFLLAALTAFLGVKRFKNSQNVRDKICFNHFLSDDSPELVFHNLYTASNYARLELIYGEKSILENFYKINKWISDYLPNFNGEAKINQRVALKSWLNVFGKFGESILSGFLGNILENVLKKYQLYRIHKNNTNIGWGRVVISDTQLEFHPHSAEREVMEKYNRKIKGFGI